MGAVTQLIIIGSNHSNDTKTLTPSYMIEIWDNSRISLVVKKVNEIELGKDFIMERILPNSPDDLEDDLIKIIGDIVRNDKKEVFNSNSIGIIPMSRSVSPEFLKRLSVEFKSFNILNFTLSDYTIYNVWENRNDTKGVFNVEK